MADTKLLQTATDKGAEELALPKVLTRDEIRANIFASKKVKIKLVDFFGQKIEIRQPQLADILQARSEEDSKNGVIGILIDHAYVPGSNDKVFEAADKDSMLQLPFGKDFLDVSNALEELTNVNFLASVDSSSKTPGST